MNFHICFTKITKIVRISLFFKNLIHRGINYTKTIRIPFIIFTFFAFVFSLYYLTKKFNLIQVFLGDFLNNNAFWFSLSFLIFFMLFFMIAFILGYFVFMSMITITIFTIYSIKDSPVREIART